MSLAAWMPSSLRFFSICLDRCMAARSSADVVQPIVRFFWGVSGFAECLGIWIWIWINAGTFPIRLSLPLASPSLQLFLLLPYLFMYSLTVSVSTENNNKCTRVRRVTHGEQCNGPNKDNRMAEASNCNWAYFYGSHCLSNRARTVFQLYIVVVFVVVVIRQTEGKSKSKSKDKRKRMIASAS